MARKKLSLSSDHIKLITAFKFNHIKLYEKIEGFTQEEDRYVDTMDKYYGVDMYCLYGYGFLYEKMALILGLNEHLIEGTEEDYDGPKYTKEAMDKMIELDTYICENLTDIEEVLHQFAGVGLREGTYTKSVFTGIWSYKED